MKRKEVIALVRRYLKGDCTAEERALVESWNNDYFARQKAEALADWDYDQIKHDVFKKIIAQKDQPLSKKPRPLYTNRWVQVAAILLIACGITFYYYKQNTKQTGFQPGSNRAVLTLADGRKISLDSAKAGIQINDEDIKYNDGTAIKAKAIVNSTMLTLSTPKGGQYQIILEDGTKVWLNAQSTITYPSRFSGDTRTVSLEGEAYFEIKEDKSKPFNVISKNQEISVLGTSFNVEAYAENKTIQTTLTSGSVLVANLQGKSITLVPGEQSTLQENGGLTKQQADLDEAISWKNGEFVFTKEPVQAVLRKLARWYNFEVSYAEQIPDSETFSGTLSRYDNVAILLDMMQQVGDIRFEVNGRNVKVYRK
ncbi:FecR family protein [bacterium A37T11]|nr:FecR family protein [bacterium A37T11]